MAFRRRDASARLAAALLLIALPAAAAPAVRRSAAFPGIRGGAGFDPAQVALVEELMLGALDATGHFRVVGASDVAAILGHERRRMALGCDDADAACVAEIAGALGVELLVAADMGRLGDTVVLTLKLLDAKKGAVLARGRTTVMADGGIPGAVEALVREALASLLQSDSADAGQALACTDGRVAAGGHCCWPGQDWGAAKGRCVGEPRCPEGRIVQADECMPGCTTDGQVLVADRCCWPGQDWGVGSNRCVGLPDCPSGWRLGDDGESCTRIPKRRSEPAAARPAPVEKRFALEIGLGMSRFALQGIAPTWHPSSQEVLFPKPDDADAPMPRLEVQAGLAAGRWSLLGGLRVHLSPTWSWWGPQLSVAGGLVHTERFALDLRLAGGVLLRTGGDADSVWLDRNGDGQRQRSEGSSGDEILRIHGPDGALFLEPALVARLMLGSRFGLALSFGWMIAATDAPTMTGAGDLDLAASGIAPRLTLDGPVLRLETRILR